MIRAGALGYVTKTIETDELVAAIRQVAAGDAYFSPRLAAFVLQAFSAPDTAGDDELNALTPREREVLHHLARGYAYKRIAARLGISARTVESHVGAVLRKLQLSSRHEVSHWAASRGLIGRSAMQSAGSSKSNRSVRITKRVDRAWSAFAQPLLSASFGKGSHLSWRIRMFLNSSFENFPLNRFFF